MQAAPHLRKWLVIRLALRTLLCGDSHGSRATSQKVVSHQAGIKEAALWRQLRKPCHISESG
jgi:hypothetical protein